MSLDFSRVQTRDGRKVEIRLTDGRGAFSIVGYVEGAGNGLRYWTPGGKGCRLSANDPEDLVPIPEERFAWVNVYENIPPCLHDTRALADKNQAAVTDTRVGRIKVKLERRFDE